MGTERVAGATPVEPNRETMRAEYKQLLRRVEADGRIVVRLEREARHRISSFRRGLQDLLEICENDTVEPNKRLMDVRDAIEESLAR